MGGRGASYSSLARQPRIMTEATQDISSNLNRELEGMSYAVMIEDDSFRSLDLTGKSNHSDAKWARSAYSNFRIRSRNSENNPIYLLSSSDYKKMLSRWKKSFAKQTGNGSEVPNTPENRHILAATRADAVRRSASRIVTREYLQGEERHRR